MLIKNLESHLNIEGFKEDLRKLGVNLITAGIAGIFLNHFSEIKLSAMILPVLWVTALGGLFLFLGLRSRKQ